MPFPFLFKAFFSFLKPHAKKKTLAVLSSADILRSFTEIQNCREKKALDKVIALALLAKEQYSPLFSVRVKKHPTPHCLFPRPFNPPMASQRWPTGTQERAMHML